LPILEEALEYKKALPVRKLNSMGEFLEKFPSVKKVILHENFQSNARKIMKVKRKIILEKRDDTHENTSQGVPQTNVSLS